MFRITLVGTDEPLLWPADMTTITDGGALLLFVKVPRDPGGPIKTLMYGYSHNQWVSIARQATASAAR